MLAILRPWRTSLLAETPPEDGDRIVVGGSSAER